MAHFAKIENGVVTDVQVASEEMFNADIHRFEGTWKQTSYNTRGGVHYGQDGEPDGGVALRGNYAGIGCTYDADNDVFYVPQPYESWTLDETTWQWISPIAYPDDGNMYSWDENAYQADNTKGWVEV